MNLKAARERQKALRDTNWKARRPDRDDVARVALFWLIRRAVEKGQEAELGKRCFQATALRSWFAA